MAANRMLISLAGALLLAGWGCDSGGAGKVDSTSTATTEATVKGIVKLNGKPVTGEITFDPGNANRKVAARSAPLGADGAYTIQTLVGGNSVTVHGPAIDKNPTLSTNSRLVEVKAGENDLSIDLP